MSKIPKALSPGEEALQLHLRAEKVLFICEYEFCPGRKWRFDFVLTGDAINDILELVRPERANALREEILA